MTTSKRSYLSLFLVFAMVLSLFSPLSTVAYAADSSTVPSGVQVLYDNSVDFRGTYYSTNLESSVNIRTIRTTYEYGGEDVSSYAFCLDKGNGLSSTDTYTYSTELVNYPAAPFIAFMLNGARNLDWDDATLQSVQGWVNAIVWLTEAGLFTDPTDYEQIVMASEERVASLTAVFPTTEHTLEASIDLLNMIVSGYNNGDYGSWSFYVYETDNAANQNLMIADYTLDLTEYWGYVQLNKTDESGNPLSGAEFTVYEGSLVRGTLTTNSAGYAVSDMLKLSSSSATLTVVETSAPSGYASSGQTYTVSVDSETNGSATTAAWVNNGSAIANSKITIPTEYVILKTDEATGEPLAGATFRLEHVTNNTTYDLVTDSSGSIQLQWLDSSADNYITPGTYTVTETSPPVGYSLSDAKVETLTFELLPVYNDDGDFDHWEQNDPGQLVYENPADNTIRFTKIDADGNVLDGGTFNVYMNGALLGQYEGGTIVLSDLKTGYYTFEEISPPSGYVMSSNPYASVYVDVTDTAADTYYLSMINYDYPDIQIRKSDPTGLGLSGAIFDVWIDGTSIGQVTTNSIGVSTISYAQYGAFLNDANDPWTVTVTEVQAPEGYLMSDTNVVTAEIQKGQTLSTIEFVNDPIPEIQIAKIDSATGLPLAGAEFAVYIDGVQIGTYYSDDDGIVSLDYNDYGNHLDLTANSWVIKVVETDAPSGYDLSDVTEQELTVVRGQTVASYTFGNYSYPQIEIYKSDEDTNRPLSGSLFKVSIDTQVLGYFSTGSDGKILISYADYYEYLGVTTDNEWVVEVEEIRAPSGYLLNADNTQTAVLNRNQGLITFSFQNEAYPEIHINKTDSNGNPLANTLFSVSVDGIEFGQFWTDNSGMITLTHDTYGDFLGDSGADSWTVTVTEVQPTTGYLLSGTTTSTQEVKRGQAVAEFTFANYEVPEIQILKTDSSTGEPLANAEFEVFINGQSIGSFYSDADGLVLLDESNYGSTFDLSASSWLFTVVEVNPPSGYALNYETTQSVTVTAGQITVPFNFSNYTYPEIQITKTDADSNEALAGAIFEVAIDAQTFGTFTTDENGEILITYDQYYEYLDRDADSWTVTVQELNAPGGYLMDGNIQSAELKRNQGLLTFSFTNATYPSIIVEKRSSTTNELLEGATFDVTIDATHIGSWTTDENGQFTITYAEYGGYLGNDTNDGWTVYVTETQSPDGYHDAEIDTQQAQMFYGQDLTPFVFVNIPRSDLLITKTDSLDGSPLEGVTFEVSRDTTSIGTFKTDANGEILIEDLEVGTYTVQEVSTIYGYVLNETPQTVEVSMTDNIFLYQLDFENDRQPTLTVNKIDSITGDPILGALFSVTYQSSKTSTGEEQNLGTYYTDASGQFSLIALDEGWYTVTELEPADGYSLAEPLVQELHLSGNENAERTFENIPLSAIVIWKRDAEDSSIVLAGAEFEISYLEGNSGTGGTVIGRYTTSANGSVTVTGLEPGTYVIEEVVAPTGYELNTATQTVYISGDEQAVVTVDFRNYKMADLVIMKQDSVTGEMLSGAKFKITYSDGTVVGNSNGYYTTDANGLITISELEHNATVIVQEVTAPDGYLLDETPQTIQLSQGEAYVLTFENDPMGGLRITKTDAEDGDRISGVKFEISHMNGELIGTYTTDSNGRIYLTGLEDGWYTVVEIQAADGYILDDTPYNAEVTAGEIATLTIENSQMSNILIRKVDSETGEGLYGAVFMVYDSTGNPIGEYTSDHRGYVYIDDIPDGRYKIREITAPEGYLLDSEYKTVTVRYGYSPEILWENTPILGQIQIIKTSADYNSTNGLAAGTLLEGAVFEIYNRSGTLVDTIVSGSNGLAVSEPLPLGTYYIREIQAPDNYSISTETVTVYLEYEGQIARVSITNESLTTGVSIAKTGPYEVMAGQPIRYTFSGIANTSSVSLNNFYWRDYLPWEFVLETVTTGTYNFTGTYKIVYRVNDGDYLVLADNLSTLQNYELLASPEALGLGSDQRVTEIMFVFGQAPAGFTQTTAPSLYGAVNNAATGGTSFTNVAEVGGLYNDQWIQNVSRWVTSVYGLPVTLPRTGY
ncbi:SpaA isopeptide-forming pilin-related protein [Bengtsoniella intestinalis]|uniref:MSCRAMM family protein n=1 Tax=Bengtsoniella intestinalis TaxID=3073143 RepID=UPI00391F3F39